jgi:hypothetical protein
VLLHARVEGRELGHLFREVAGWGRRCYGVGDRRGVDLKVMGKPGKVMSPRAGGLVRPRPRDPAVLRVAASEAHQEEGTYEEPPKSVAPGRRGSCFHLNGDAVYTSLLAGLLPAP